MSQNTSPPETYFRAGRRGTQTTPERGSRITTPPTVILANPPARPDRTASPHDRKLNPYTLRTVARYTGGVHSGLIQSLNPVTKPIPNPHLIPYQHLTWNLILDLNWNLALDWNLNRNLTSNWGCERLSRIGPWKVGFNRKAGPQSGQLTQTGPCGGGTAHTVCVPKVDSLPSKAGTALDITHLLSHINPPNPKPDSRPCSCGFGQDCAGLGDCAGLKLS